MTSNLNIDLIHGFGASCSKGFQDSVGIMEDDNYRKIIFPIGKYIAIK